MWSSWAWATRRTVRDFMKHRTHTNLWKHGLQLIHIRENNIFTIKILYSNVFYSMCSKHSIVYNMYTELLLFSFSHHLLATIFIYFFLSVIYWPRMPNAEVVFRWCVYWLTNCKRVITASSSWMAAPSPGLPNTNMYLFRPLSLSLVAIRLLRTSSRHMVSGMHYGRNGAAQNTLPRQGLYPCYLFP